MRWPEAFVFAVIVAALVTLVVLGHGEIAGGVVFGLFLVWMMREL